MIHEEIESKTTEQKGWDLAEFFFKINRWAEGRKKFVMAFDKIQVVRGDKSILRLLAHVLIPIIISSSS